MFPSVLEKYPLLCRHWQRSMNLLNDKFWREIKPSHLDDRTHKSIEWSKELMLEIHNGAKYVLEEHFYFFEKFLEMFQTCSVSQKWFRIGSAPYKFSYFLLEMTAVLNLDRYSNQLSNFGELFKSALQIWLPDRLLTHSWLTPKKLQTYWN